MTALPIFERIERGELTFPPLLQTGRGRKVARDFVANLKQSTKIDATNVYDAYTDYCSTKETDRGPIRQHVDIATFPQVTPPWKHTWIEWCCDAIDARYDEHWGSNEAALVGHLRRGDFGFDQDLTRCTHNVDTVDLDAVTDLVMLETVLPLKDSVLMLPCQVVVLLNSEGRKLYAVEFKPTELRKTGKQLIWTTVFNLPLFTFALCHCKNISTDSVTDHAKTDYTGRIKSLRTKAYRYHVLKIDGSHGGKSHEGTGDGSLKGRHLCRGNFATYGPDAPLFGTITGTFWRPMHMRGSTKHGVIEKTYSIDTAALHPVPTEAKT